MTGYFDGMILCWSCFESTVHGPTVADCANCSGGTCQCPHTLRGPGMNIRELVSLLVDADVETGAMTPAMVKDETGKIHTVTRVEIEEQSSDEDGNATSTGPTVWIHTEEY